MADYEHKTARPSAREAELVKVLIEEDDAGQYGLLPTCAAQSLVFD